MELNENDSIKELEYLLKELDALAPKRDTQVVYRQVNPDEIIDDSLSESEDEPIEETMITKTPNFNTTPANNFSISEGGPIAAVDCGIIRLGETENGLIIALRAVIVLDKNEESLISAFKTGPIYLHNNYKLKILHEMGRNLGKEDLFVELDKKNSKKIIPIKIKSGVADNAHQYGDRFRNWLERLVQKIAVNSIENGTIIFDGALTLRTRDTHESYLENLARLASQAGNSIVAISKQSMLQIQGTPIRFWLKDVTNKACYRNVTIAMRKEGADRVLGNAYATRFSILGPTFRMDIKPKTGETDKESIDKFYSSTLMRGGYPDILVRAHAHSYFTAPDVIQLQAQASAKYKLIPQGDIDLSGIFAPFGGKFK